MEETTNKTAIEQNTTVEQQKKKIEEVVVATNPDFAQFIEGEYRNAEENGCAIALFIGKSGIEGYSYTLDINNKYYKGYISFSEGDESYITLEEIEWKENIGQLSDDDNPEEMESIPTYGLDFLWYDNTLTLQNYGNSMNYYVKTDCVEKYITLVKVN